MGYLIYFTEIEPNTKAKCNFCSQILSIRGGSIFTLSRHLKNKHLYAYSSRQTEKTSQRTVEEPPADGDSEDRGVVINETKKSQVQEDRPSASTIVCGPSRSTAVTATLLVATSSSASSSKQKCSLPIHHYFNKPMNSRRRDDINRLIIQLIVKEHLPFQIVESPHFLKFLNALNLEYQLPTRKL